MRRIYELMNDDNNNRFTVIMFRKFEIKLKLDEMSR